MRTTMFKKLYIFLFLSLFPVSIYAASDSFDPSVSTQTLGTAAYPWYSVTALSFISPKTNGVAGDMSLYGGNSTDTKAAGWRGNSSAMTYSYRGILPATRSAGTNRVQTWTNAGETGTGTDGDPYLQAIGWFDLGTLATLTSPALVTPTITLPEVDGHATVGLTAANVSNTTIYNTGMGGADVALTLPVAAAGYSAVFTVGTAQAYKWGVRANTSDKIYLINSDGTVTAGSDNGYARMTNAQVGQCFACWTFKTDNYDWMCKAISIGTSTFSAN